MDENKQKEAGFGPYLKKQQLCQPVWPDWAIFCCLADFLAQIAHNTGLFLIKSHFLVKVFLGNFLSTLVDF